MKTVTLPRTDLTVSRLVLGCWGLTSDFHWGERDESESRDTVRAALDLGVSFFDTAAMYADGASEELLGRTLAADRDRAVIASKARPDAMRPEDIVAACERSLERLRTDRIDLYQTHWFADRSVAAQDSWAALIKLRDQGKVRAIGVCNAGVDDLAAVTSLEPPTTNQLPYNLLWRAIEAEIVPACRARSIGILAYSPLQHGLLAGKYSRADDVPDGRARSRHFSTERALARHGEAGCENETFAAIDAVTAVAKDLGRDVSAVALAWLTSRAGVTCVIAGARTPAQLEQNVAALESPLPTEAVARLDAATSALDAALGPNPDMWQGREGSRFH